MSLRGRVTLQKIETPMAERIETLLARAQAGDEAAWTELWLAVPALAALQTAATPGSSAELLTTQQMAERLGIKAKTLLRRKARGEIRPAVAAGKLLRWSGRESL